MDHLPIPESCKARVKEVPYLGLAPKYDRKGFDGFPERCGIDIESILKPAKIRSRTVARQKAEAFLDPEYVESFLQEWLWFGILHEFERECGLDLDASQFIRPGRTNGSRILNTEPLLQYVPSVMIDRLRKAGVPIDLEVGDWVYHSSGPKAKPCQITEDLGDLQYLVPGLQSEGISASSLVRAKEQMSRPEQNPSLSPLSCIAFKGIWREFKAVLDRPADSGKSQPLSGGLISVCLDKANGILHQDATAGRQILRLDLWMSMVVLLLSLENVMCTIFHKPTTLFLNTGISTIFLREMAKENWCQLRTDWLSYADLTKLYVGSLLPSYETVSHLACSRSLCTHRPTSVHQQKAKHRYEACACGLVSFEEADLVRIMRSGGIPGISQCGFPTLPEEQRSYHLVDVTGNDFVAISHVWSHGLGNPSGNALPVCQLRYLFELIRKISSTEVYLWIDTISVPVTREHKKIALTTLGQVYRQAHHVLVIDRHLVQVGLEPYERQLQLRSSEWIGRLWTFQEGRLAKNLCIQFKDGAVPASELLQTRLDIGEIGMRAIFCDFETDCRKPLEYILTNDDDGKHRLFDLAPALAFRSVTDPNDEPICIATLLGLDFDRFQSEPSMMDIYQSLTELPRHVLFLSGPRLRVPGFRWAPSTFMTGHSWEPRAQQLLGTLGDGGFQIHTDCILLSEDFGTKFTYASHVRFNIECEGIDNFSVVNLADTVDDVLAAAGTHQFAILLSSPASGFWSASRAVLASFDPLDQFYRCRYVMGLLVLRTSRCTNSLVARLENYTLDHVFTVKGKPAEQVLVCVS
jgi:hypothetical protein